MFNHRALENWKGGKSGKTFLDSIQPNLGTLVKIVKLVRNQTIYYSEAIIAQPPLQIEIIQRRGTSQKKNIILGVIKGT